MRFFESYPHKSGIRKPSLEKGASPGWNARFMNRNLLRLDGTFLVRHLPPGSSLNGIRTGLSRRKMKCERKSKDLTYKKLKSSLYSLRSPRSLSMDSALDFRCAPPEQPFLRAWSNTHCTRRDFSIHESKYVSSEGDFSGHNPAKMYAPTCCELSTPSIHCDPRMRFFHSNGM